MRAGRFRGKLSAVAGSRRLVAFRVAIRSFLLGGAG